MASYLNIPNIIAAAVSRGADAIHPVRTLIHPACSLKSVCEIHPDRPSETHLYTTCLWQPVYSCCVYGAMAVVAVQGYGFLSENATFVDICKDHGIEFIGPTSDHINIMGDKSTARDTMKVRPTENWLRGHSPLSGRSSWQTAGSGQAWSTARRGVLTCMQAASYVKSR